MASAENIKLSVAENLRMMMSPITGVVWLLTVILTVLAGPFGTFESMELSARALYWISVVSLALVCGYVVRGVILVMIGRDRPALFDLAASIVVTVVFTPILVLIGRGVERVLGGMPPEFPNVVIYTFAVAFAAYVSRRVVVRAEECTYPFLENDDEQSEPRLMSRLSPEIRGKIIRISGQDHHVEIATSAGSETLRLRLTDAISEMDEVEGYCTHRSHWVAREAIVQVTRENSHKINIVLSNGDVVPVSRKYKPCLEEADII
ncbi:LytTR family DNA-binding domain-containing protein [Roseovarius rhodophyticola]|uniref:LytTR family transcriptional regulator DNA-binding domain-containing protein n=1 Tax=Roseovarius rhodophyticola TaxID=3080827 RepID=A0ABZ2TDK7_9RHOB|nr:LytTR family transcriptional regulator DNA-binding domain-containing protein [Roseovarius sp. W115]